MMSDFMEKLLNGIKRMTKTVKLIFLTALTIIFSCEDSNLITNCNDCSPNEPEIARLEVKTSVHVSRTSVVLRIFEGNLEDSILYRTFYPTGTITETSVNINKLYTVTATYNTLKGTYVVVDAAKPGVKFEEDLCDEPCYLVYNRKIDLRLKY